MGTEGDSAMEDIRQSAAGLLPGGYTVDEASDEMLYDGWVEAIERSLDSWTVGDQAGSKFWDKVAKFLEEAGRGIAHEEYSLMEVSA